MFKHLPYSLFFIYVFSSCETTDYKNWSNKTNTATEAKIKKKIYFTFDDGPTSGTNNVYKILNEEKIPAGLFLVGMHYEQNPSGRKLVDSMRNNPLMTFANHSYSHAFKNHFPEFYAKAENVVVDFSRSKSIFNNPTLISRGAGRNVWKMIGLDSTDHKFPDDGLDSIAKQGFQLMGWDVSWPYDEKTKFITRNADEMMNRMHIYLDSNKTVIPNHLVLLAHDQEFKDTLAFNELKKFIQLIKKSDIYEFEDIKKYPGLSKK